MSKYDEDLKKACEILNNTELDELVQVAVEAMDDAATDIGMEASQEWHAKITLESALIHIAEKVSKRSSLTIPKSIADELDSINASEYENLIENFFEYYNDSISSKRLDEFCMYPFNLNLCILYLVSIELGVDLVKVVEG